MQPSLVVLAAGMGSRFGGLKQLEPFGPNGETLLEYSVYDAVQAGFGEIVFVIREAFSGAFTEQVLSRFPKSVRTRLAFQRMEDLPDPVTVPAGRSKPWGTAHAVWSARSAVHGPFAVINADDYYGTQALVIAAEFLTRSELQKTVMPTFALIAYPLNNTLSEHGSVSRGLCTASAEGWLQSIREIKRIEPASGGGVATNADGTEERIPGDALVSMNLFAFTPDFFDIIKDGLIQFQQNPAMLETGECYLPTAATNAIQTRQARIQLLSTTEQWFGVTYPEDKPKVEAAIKSRIASGVFPSELW